jgi:hypothetical protein
VIEKHAAGPQETATFAGIDMIQQAVVQLSSMNPAPYSANTLDRKTVFTIDDG